MGSARLGSGAVLWHSQAVPLVPESATGNYPAIA